ncbi:MAG TPA: GDP-L-fucose synthase [Bacteroidales bacterium]|nr:GDP-L-fucose synthase [Bacteroidales bacterium]HPI87160.1 GDP-L-fucose synthase [Bacteroidales bacterium]HPM91361.1 GDP-L-fucose synthase [Bacteroidales bacterium]
MNKDSKIYIAGHNGMVGSALHRNLEAKGYRNFIFRTFDELDLTRQDDVEAFFEAEEPEYVFDAAAKVGGIVANDTFRAQFIYENLMIQNNLIHSSYKNGVKKFLFLGSSCIYPKLAPQPLKEEYLLTGSLEPTNEPYAIAKIAGIKMCENYYRQYRSNFISVMPTNLYGPNDNYDLQNSHVIPALLRKFHDAMISNAPSVTLWGTGQPLREFMHVDDMARACILVMEKLDAPKLYDDLGLTHINIGVGEDITILELGRLIAKITGYTGKILFDTSKPDGTPRKIMDNSRLRKLGFKPRISLEEGLAQTYKMLSLSVQH